MRQLQLRRRWAFDVSEDLYIQPDAFATSHFLLWPGTISPCYSFLFKPLSLLAFFFFLISLFSLCFVVFLRSLPINIPFHRVTLMKGRASKSEPKHSNDSRRLVVAAPPFKSRIANFVIIPFCLILLIY